MEEPTLNQVYSIKKLVGRLKNPNVRCYKHFDDYNSWSPKRWTITDHLIIQTSIKPNNNEERKKSTISYKNHQKKQKLEYVLVRSTWALT